MTPLKLFENGKYIIQEKSTNISLYQSFHMALILPTVQNINQP